MYVYLLRSKKEKSRKYVGLTHDIRFRLQEHNNGNVMSTRKSRPWNLETYIWFKDAQKAEEFEKYLKHGSGHTFATRHLWSTLPYQCHPA